MTRTKRSFVSTFVIAVLATGCASIARASDRPAAQAAPAATVATDCQQLGADISRVEDNKRAAIEKEKNARKPIIPVVAIAHYVSSKSTAETTDRQIKELRAEFSRQGCDRHGT